MTDLHELDATALSDAIASGRVTAAGTMAHLLARIEALNPLVNAIVSLRPSDELMAEARLADGSAPRGPLHGLPFAVKDLVDTAGLRTTYGSPLFAAHVPIGDAPLVRRLKAAGAIVIGKTNVPEFGLGSQSYNPVHGVTRNPYDLARTAGGSSGGAAAALAARLVPLADGSDMMGSLRNPAAFCNVYGLRPSVGLVPREPSSDPRLPPLSTDGPMARSVRDLALLLDVLAGDGSDDAPEGVRATRFVHALADVPDGPTPLADRRLGWLGDWNGHYPMEPGVLDTCEAALTGFERLGATLVPVVPRTDPGDLWRAWTTLRSASLAASLRPHFEDPGSRRRLKPEACWEVERGLALGASDIEAALDVRARWLDETDALFDGVDALVLPSAQVFPFDAGTHWPSVIDGRAMRTYHEWMAVVVPASLAGLPVLAVPAGFGAAGPPAGLQLIGRHGRDAALLRLGEARHRAIDWPAKRPPAFGSASG